MHICTSGPILPSGVDITQIPRSDAQGINDEVLGTPRSGWWAREPASATSNDLYVHLLDQVGMSPFMKRLMSFAQPSAPRILINGLPLVNLVVAEPPSTHIVLHWLTSESWHWKASMSKDSDALPIQRMSSVQLSTFLVRGEPS